MLRQDCNREIRSFSEEIVSGAFAKHNTVLLTGKSSCFLFRPGSIYKVAYLQYIFMNLVFQIKYCALIVCIMYSTI